MIASLHNKPLRVRFEAKFSDRQKAVPTNALFLSFGRGNFPKSIIPYGQLKTDDFLKSPCNFFVDNSWKLSDRGINMINVEWDNPEKTVIRLDYFEPIASWEEYQKAVKDSYEMVGSQAHNVYLIHHPGEATMPAGNAIAQIRRAVNAAPANTTAILMVISNDFARRILQVVIKITMSRKPFYFVTSIEEARKLIEIQNERVSA
jgi:hypothetical protein